MQPMVILNYCLRSEKLCWLVSCRIDCVCVCVCVCVVALDVFWYHDARQLDEGSENGRCTVTQDQHGLCQLQLRNVESRDSGCYVVVAVNDHATCKHTFQVSVNDRTYIIHKTNERQP